ncbi:hypothetical protein DID88_006167 [Monilinia fructigena]|uniref:Uncharacterized protein n=1 Tax=Monilinia fructigena TaxID=38457 RepID=A0A395J1V2_9HELO|nr:hypothetical protein DID88_006167 [Monilinia fructigena]
MADINPESKRFQHRAHTGVYVEFHCGHQKPANAVVTEKEDSTFKNFKYGFEVYQSDDDYPSCKGEDHLQDDISNYELSLSAKVRNPMCENPYRLGLNNNFRQYCNEPAVLGERTDSTLSMIEALERQEREQDLDEMMHSTTSDLAPESGLLERKESKIEKAMAISHWIWGSLKKIR